MSPEEIKEILDKHRLWLDGKPAGKRADLPCARLYGANLRGANLERVNLSNAYLHCADLQGANLSGANLRGADLTGANLRGASLNGADLSDANLYVANLSSADLSRAYLLSADLHCAYLRGAKLYDTNLDERFMLSCQIVPEGDLIVWKATRDKGLVKLKIPSEAKRVGGLTGRKCRAEYADVIEVIGSGVSLHNPDFTYTAGTRVYPDKFDPDMRIECAPGIHFFITRQEAEDYK